MEKVIAFFKSIGNNYKEVYNKRGTVGKVFMVLGTLYLCGVIITFAINGFGNTLPSCSDSDLTNKKLPALIKDTLYESGVSRSTVSSITISKPEELESDTKAGFRLCEANMTVRANAGQVYTDIIQYQIAWSNKEKGIYEYRILE